ncbi:hypothetical protein [Rhodoblastus sp.]|uniref:hypothetical protein n=1 Tax=Rhodoblastus sp. TaxID=1962975 RepID=UPI003F994F0C
MGFEIKVWRASWVGAVAAMKAKAKSPGFKEAPLERGQAATEIDAPTPKSSSM